MSDYPKLEQLTRQDGKGITMLTRKIGWDFSKEDWEAILACGPLFGMKDEKNEVLSTAAIFPSGPDLAFVGAVMVDPDHHCKGYGRLMMERCLKPLENTDSVTYLISTMAAEKLYDSLGFENVSQSIRLEGASSDLVKETLDLPAIRMRDLVNVVKLDAEAYGGQRYGLIKRRITQAVKTAVVEDSEGNTSGFALAVPKIDALRIGPVVAPDVDTAMQLVKHLSKDHDGTIRVEVMQEQVTFIETLKSNGLEVVSKANVKSLGGKAIPGARNRYFAIDSQTFG